MKTNMSSINQSKECACEKTFQGNCICQGLCTCHKKTEPTHLFVDKDLMQTVSEVTRVEPKQGWEEEWKGRFIELGADLEHFRWAQWQAYVFSISKLNSDGSITIAKENVDRWTRQIGKTYENLSEKEKESDRKEVRKYLPIISQLLTTAKAEGYEQGYLEAQKKYEK